MKQNLLVALVDKNLNIFSETPLGLPQRIYNIIEHDSRLDEFSQECQFFIDEAMYIALGFQGVPFKFTKVFVEDDQLHKYENKRYCKFYSTKDFHKMVKNYNDYEENRPLFLMGGSEFLKQAMRISSKMLLTVVDEENENGYEKFPINEAMQTFKGRREIESTVLPEIKKYKESLRKKRQQEFEISSNGMKIVKEPEQKFTQDLLDTPNYKFYEYRK